MPVINRALSDSICPPGQPSCIEDAQNRAIADQQGGQTSDTTPSYAGPVIFVVLVVIFFILWLSWAQWPKDKIKAFWKTRIRRKKEDKGIRSPGAQKDNSNPVESQHGLGYGDVRYIPEEDLDLEDLQIDEKEFGPRKVTTIGIMK